MRVACKIHCLHGGVNIIGLLAKTNHRNGTLADKLMRKKTLIELQEILDKYSALYTDWEPANDGGIRVVVNENKKDLLLEAFLDLTLLIEKSLNK
jgi:hypothetical protein